MLKGFFGFLKIMINSKFRLALLLVNCLVIHAVKLGSSSEQATANTIFITADNLVDSITINGRSVDLTGVAGLGDWTQTSTVNVGFEVEIGDKIEITATNYFKWSVANPGSIIATIYYKDKTGNVAALSTSSYWTCDGSSPLIYGSNGVIPWGTRPKIDVLAQQIWNINAAKPQTICSINVPDSKNARIYVTAAKTINEISVGGVKIDLTRFTGIDDWVQTKIYEFNIRDGDTISISGSNNAISTSSPATILATIIYKNKNGETVTLNTGKNWECDGKAPKFYGINGIGPWSLRPNIDRSAQHIWNINVSEPNTTCTFTTIIPKNGKLFVTVDNIITDIIIAGVKLDLAKTINLNDWTKTKTFDIEYYDGDEISITGQNLGGYSISNPGSIIATINYSAHGVDKELNTTEDWICNDKPAQSLGSNGAAPWGTRSLISLNANHIWSSTLKDGTVTCTLAKRAQAIFCN